MKYTFPVAVALCCFCACPSAFTKAPVLSPELTAIVAKAAATDYGQSLESFREVENLVRRSVSDPALRQHAEAVLVNLLAPASTPLARSFACKQLGIMGSATALPALAALLKNPETVAPACLALTTYPAGEADRTLREALAGSEGVPRLQIIQTIGDRRDAKAIRILARLAKGDDSSAAEAAIVALGKVGDKKAATIIASLRRSSPLPLQPVLEEAALRCAERAAAAGARKAAVSRYEELVASAASPHVRRGAFEALLRVDADRGETRILRTLRGPDEALKASAIAAVRALPAPGASGKFAAEMSHLTPAQQTWMLDSLAARADEPARAAIVKSLRSPDATVRTAAISALGQIGNASAAGALAYALSATQDPEESRTIETALAGMPASDSAVNAAIEAGLQESRGKTRARLIGVLASRKGPECKALLFREAAGSDLDAAAAAFRALARLADGTDAPALVSALLRISTPALLADAESAAAQALSKVPEASRRTPLVCDALERQPAPETRKSLIALLPACGDGKALATLETAAADADPAVQSAAVRALTEWPDAAAWKTLAAIYTRPSAAQSGLALRGLVRLASEENSRTNSGVAAKYRELLLSARSDGDLKLILGALGGASDPDTLQLALPLLTNTAVRAEAEAAVRKIAESIKANHPQMAQEALEKLKASAQ
jgi:HEAT repeat protein